MNSSENIIPDTKVEEVVPQTVHRPLCEKIQYRSFKEAQAVINYAKKRRKYINGKRSNRRIAY